jgi:thioredoxin
MANIVQVQQEAGWKIIESSPTPVLVDFWADWCGPCRMLSPTIDKLAEGYGSRMSFAKVNVDEMPDLASRFSVCSIPTLILLREGKILERVVGLRSYGELAQLLDQTLSPSNPDKRVEL